MGIFTFLKELIRSEDSEDHPGDEQLLKALNLKNGLANDLDAATRTELDALLSPSLKQENHAACFKLAAQHLEMGQYDEAIYIYRTLGDAWPELRHDCEGQIGVVHYCKGDYRKAIESYIAARVHGADADWMDETIWEACETLMQQEEDVIRMREPLNLYLTLCPKGEYVAQARALLENLRPNRPAASDDDEDEDTKEL